MRDPLTNLLPDDRLRALRRTYFLRLGATASVLATFLIAAYALMLLPTYMYLLSTASAKHARLASIESSLASSDEAELSVRLDALSSDAATLVALGSAPSVVGLVRQTLAVSRPGITLSGFSYTPAAGKTPSALAVSGTAATRDALRQYQIALQALPFVASADLPVSAYAQDSNISFTITLTLSP
jgi:hypothetical protein